MHTGRQVPPLCPPAQLHIISLTRSYTRQRSLKFYTIPGTPPSIPNQQPLLSSRRLRVQIDAAIMGEFGMPMGPFRLSDLVGGDIGVHVGKNFIDSFPERTVVSTLLPRMMEAKRLGEKTGKGFYKVR